jgi:hypothetical protein
MGKSEKPRFFPKKKREICVATCFQYKPNLYYTCEFISQLYPCANNTIRILKEFYVTQENVTAE